MDLLTGIQQRKSTRAFAGQEIPRAILEEIMNAANRAPSWSNIQPWKFAVTGGRTLDAIRLALEEKAKSGVKPNPDIPFPTSFPPEIDARRREFAAMLYSQAGIPREDKESRKAFHQRMYRFFDAPHGIFVLTDRALSEWSLLDCGLAIQNLILAAHAFGLGTCIEAAVASYPGEVRRILGLPDTERIVCGVAVGYPDAGAVINKLRSPRAPLDSFVYWYLG